MNDRDHMPMPVGSGAGNREPAGTFRPDASSVERLLTAARAHPFGIDYLMKGYLGSVAATFGVHAFTVEEARRRAGLGTPGTKGDRDGLP